MSTSRRKIIINSIQRPQRLFCKLSWNEQQKRVEVFLIVCDKIHITADKQILLPSFHVHLLGLSDAGGFHPPHNRHPCVSVHVNLDAAENVCRLSILKNSVLQLLRI